MIILWNNQWKTADEAVIPLQSEAVMFGLGAFETLRANLGGQLIQAEAHIERLLDSLYAMDLNVSYSSSELLTMLEKVAYTGKDTIQRMKIIVVPEGVAVISEPLNIDSNVYNGVSLKSVIQHRSLPEIKSLSYLECLLSYRDAQSNGYFEALMVSKTGEVYEGSRSNIFWFEGETLVTRESGILPGITRQLVLDHAPFDTRFSGITLHELVKKDEVFMTSTTLGVVPVNRIDKFENVGEKSHRNTKKVWDIIRKKFYV